MYLHSASIAASASLVHSSLTLIDVPANASCHDYMAVSPGPCLLNAQSHALQVQTIGLLAHLRSKSINGPFMVIGPLSTLSNWVNEVERWCPAMPVVLYHGTQAERQALRSKRMSQGAPVRSAPESRHSYPLHL